MYFQDFVVNSLRKYIFLPTSKILLLQLNNSEILFYERPHCAYGCK